MRIKSFLKKYVDGYLFKDLNTLRKIKLRKNQRIGGVGYPMMMTLLSGMELLGGLLQKKEFDPFSKHYFRNFWNNFLSVKFNKYANYEPVFRRLIRNGIAHTFITKSGIYITKGAPEEHLKQYKNGTFTYLIVDIHELHSDFLATYEDLIKPIIYKDKAYMDINKEVVNTRLNEMINIYDNESIKILEAIPLQPNIQIRDFMNVLNSLASVPASGTAITYSGMINKEY